MQIDQKGALGVCLLAWIPWPFGYLEGFQQVQFPLSELPHFVSLPPGEVGRK